MALLYTNNNYSERETKKRIPFLFQQQQKNKVPRNKFNQEVKDVYLVKYRTLKKEIEGDTNKWKHIPCS